VNTARRRIRSGAGGKKKQGFVARHRSSACLSLTVPLAATFDQKMLKRPTLDLSARRHPGPEPLFSFSEYEAFALLNGLARLATGFAVSIMRRIRLDLEREHARILQQCPDKLFDQQAIRSRARPGDIAVDNTDPVFLTIAPKKQRAADEGGQPRYPLCAKEWSRSANSVAI
jgi:hypothetical protein